MTKKGNVIHYNGDIDYDRLSIILTKYCSHFEVVKSPETFRDIFRLTLSAESLVNMLNHIGEEIPTNKLTNSEKEKKIDSLLDDIKKVTDI